MQKFISCDWGTSALRLRIVDMDESIISVEIANEQGIADTFNLWKQSGKAEEERMSFYQSVLTESIRKIEEQSGLSLQGLPLIISGMASSSIGMMELPYKQMPFSIEGIDLIVKTIEATADFKHSMLIISGAKTEDDAMRGEETQLTGCLNNDNKEDQLIIFPGTHSKHITIKNGEAVNVTTYMTGEFFELLSKKSILSNSVEETKDLLNTANLKNFEKGVADSLDSTILHNSFVVRTNQLFDKLSKEENYSYLSGLLIGTELKEIIKISIPLTIVGNELHIKLYSSALKKSGMPNIKYHDAGKAVTKGHRKIYDLYKSKLATGNTFIK